MTAPCNPESDLTALRVKVAEQRSGNDPRLQSRSAKLALALGYLFDPMHGPLNAFWIHEQTGERRTDEWVENHFADLNACAELIDLLADKGWTCSLDNGLDKTWECTFETGTSGHKDFKQVYRGAATLPLAIITAFIAVMEESKSDSGKKPQPRNN